MAEIKKAEAVVKPVWDVEVPAELVRLSLEHTIDVLGVPN